MRRIQVTVTTNSSGDGSAYSEAIIGRLYGVLYKPGTLATGATLTLTSEGDASKPLLTKANAGTANVWFYPRDLVNAVADGAALTGTAGGDRVFPICEGRFKVLVASGGDTFTGSVIFYVMLEE